MNEKEDGLTDVKVIALMATGAVLCTTDNDGAELITQHGKITAEQWNRLGRAGYLKPFANNGGAWLSDKGLKAYMRATDELKLP